VDYLRALLLVQMGNASQVDLAADTRAQAAKHAKAFSTSQVMHMIKAFNFAATDLRGGWQPSLPLEMALAEVIEAPKILYQTATPADEIKTPAKEKGEKPAIKPTVQKDVEATRTGSTAQTESSITLEQVSKAWKQIRARIKPQSPSLDGLLNSCRLLEVKNGVLVIGFASELLRSKVDMPEQIEITRKAIVEICGGELSIKCVVTNAKQSPPPDVKADGMVAAAIKAGGEIVDIQE